jgi:hypothetical protein
VALTIRWTCTCHPWWGRPVGHISTYRLHYPLKYLVKRWSTVEHVVAARIRQYTVAKVQGISTHWLYCINTTYNLCLYKKEPI